MLQPGMLGQPLGEDQLGGPQLAAKAEPHSNIEEQHMDDMWNFFLKVGLLSVWPEAWLCMVHGCVLAWAELSKMNTI